MHLYTSSDTPFALYPESTVVAYGYLTCGLDSAVISGDLQRASFRCSGDTGGCGITVKPIMSVIGMLDNCMLNKQS